jgi:hypothetical protein
MKTRIGRVLLWMGGGRKLVEIEGEAGEKFGGKSMKNREEAGRNPRKFEKFS